MCGKIVPGIPLTTATINERRADPNYAEIRFVLNGSRGYYDAARVSLVLSRWRGLSMDVAYWFETRITLRAESINLFNTPQFADPGAELSSPNFGQITNTLNDGRAFRITAQIGW